MRVERSHKQTFPVLGTSQLGQRLAEVVGPQLVTDDAEMQAVGAVVLLSVHAPGVDVEKVLWDIQVAFWCILPQK